MSISRRVFSGNALALAFASALFNAESALALPPLDASSAEAHTTHRILERLLR